VAPNFFIHHCLEWGNIIAFTKVFTIYQIYHTWSNISDQVLSNFCWQCGVCSWAVPTSILIFAGAKWIFFHNTCNTEFIIGKLSVITSSPSVPIWKYTNSRPNIQYPWIFVVVVALVMKLMVSSFWWLSSQVFAILKT
jgi:hypothetical protein